MVNNETILSVSELSKYFRIKKLNPFKKVYAKALDGVSFEIKKGDVLGLVGESGCGKSTTGNLIAGLIKASNGEIIFKNINITNLSQSKFRKIRKSIQMIFQDPYGSLNPKLSALEIITEGLLNFNKISKKDKINIGEELLKKVGLSSRMLQRTPSEFSGGQRQRLCIARAIAPDPDFLICDEPVSSLDVSVRAQILNLLYDIKEEKKLSALFISHDLSVIKHISNYVAVMYLGKIVEYSDNNTIFQFPLHPYTKALFSAVPTIQPGNKRKRIILEGEIPSPVNPPDGCSFHTRCPEVMDICKELAPNVVEISPRHFCSCHKVKK